MYKQHIACQYRNAANRDRPSSSADGAGISCHLTSERGWDRPGTVMRIFLGSGVFPADLVGLDDDGKDRFVDLEELV